MTDQLNGSSPPRCTNRAQLHLRGCSCSGSEAADPAPLPRASAACFQIFEWPAPVRKGVGPMKGPSINSVATDPDLQYAVALSDQNMVIVWKRVGTDGSS